MQELSETFEDGCCWCEAVFWVVEGDEGVGGRKADRDQENEDFSDQEKAQE